MIRQASESRRRLGLALAAAALSLGLSPLATAQTPPAREPIRLAMIEGLSGPFANAGEAVFRNLLWAVERVNQRGGVRLPDGARRLELVRMDSKGNADEALSLLRAAVDQRIGFVLQGNSSAVAAALVDAMNKHNEREPARRVVFLNYSAVEPALTNERCSFWHFRFDAHADMRLAALMDVLRDDRELKRVYLIGQDYSFGQHVVRQARSLIAAQRPDIEIVGDELHPMGRVKDFLPYASKIRASGAQAVVTGNWGNDLSLLVKAAKDAGLQARFFTYYAGGLGTPQAMGASGEGKVLQLTEWHMNVPTKSTEKFALDFNKKYPGIWFYYLRVNTMVEMVAKAMNTAKSTDPKQVALALENMRFPAENGQVWMRKSDHQLIQPLFISIFSKADGKTVKHDSEGTGFGWKTLASIPEGDSELPTSCVMARP